MSSGLRRANDACPGSSERATAASLPGLAVVASGYRRTPDWVRRSAPARSQGATRYLSQRYRTASEGKSKTGGSRPSEIYRLTTFPSSGYQEAGSVQDPKAPRSPRSAARPPLRTTSQHVRAMSLRGQPAPGSGAGAPGSTPSLPSGAAASRPQPTFRRAICYGLALRDRAAPGGASGRPVERIERRQFISRHDILSRDGATSGCPGGLVWRSRRKPDAGPFPSRRLAELIAGGAHIRRRLSPTRQERDFRMPAPAAGRRHVNLIAARHNSNVLSPPAWLSTETSRPSFASM